MYGFLFGVNSFQKDYELNCVEDSSLYKTPEMIQDFVDIDPAVSEKVLVTTIQLLLGIAVCFSSIIPEWV